MLCGCLGRNYPGKAMVSLRSDGFPPEMVEARRPIFGRAGSKGTSLWVNIKDRCIKPIKVVQIL